MLRIAGNEFQQSFERVFQNMDVDGDKSITRQEFQDYCAKNHVSLAQEIVQIMISCGSGSQIKDSESSGEAFERVIDPWLLLPPQRNCAPLNPADEES